MAVISLNGTAIRILINYNILYLQVIENIRHFFFRVLMTCDRIVKYCDPDYLVALILHT